MAGATDWTDLSARIYLPRKIPHQSGDPLFYDLLHTIDAPGEKVAWIFPAPETGSIKGIEFRTGTVGIGDTFDLMLEGVTSAGEPNGVPLTTDASIQVTIASDDDDTWIVPPDFPASVPVTQGQLIAAVLSIPTGGIGDLGIDVFSTVAFGSQFLPRCVRYTTSWSDGSDGLIIAVKYSDDAYRHVIDSYPYETVDVSGFDVNTTPDEKGLKFKAPFNCRVIGYWAWMFHFGDHDVKLYRDDTDDTLLASISIDRHWSSSTAAKRSYERLFSASVNLEAGEWYRLSLAPTTTTDVELYSGITNSQAVFDSLENGPDFHYTERTDGGSWTDTTTKRPFMGLIIDQLDASDEPITTTSASTSQSSTASTSATTSATGTSNTTSASTSATTVATTTASTSMTSTASTSMTTTASTTASTSASSSATTALFTSASTSASTSYTSTASTSATTTATTSYSSTASTSASTSYTSTASTSATTSATGTSNTTSASTSATSSATVSITSASTSASSTASTSATTSASFSVSTSATTTASTSATTTFTVVTVTVPQFTETVETAIPMLLLNRAGDSQRNPIITDIPFQYKFNKHDSTETLTALVVRVGGTIITDLTSRCVVSNFLITCDVTAGVDLQSGYPAVLNVFHITTVVNGVAYQAKHGIWVSNEIETMIALDGFIAESSGEPVVFRPQS